LAHRDYDVRVSGREYRFRVREGGEGTFIIELGGRKLEVRVAGSPSEGDFTLSLEGRDYPVRVRPSGSSLEVHVGGHTFTVDLSAVRPVKAGGMRGPTGPPGPGVPPSALRQKAARVSVRGAITSPIPGRVVALKVKAGDRVREGDVLLVIEAMKMENEIRAPRDGHVKEVLVQEGSSVSAGQPLLVLD